MRRLTLLAFVLVLALAMLALPAAADESGPAAFGGHYYEVVVAPSSTWNQAATAVEDSTYLGSSGHLVVITSQDESNFVAGLAPDSGGAWIGLDDKANEGDFRWATGEPLTFTRWANGEPNDAFGEDCVNTYGSNQAWWGGTARWNDLDCDVLWPGYVTHYVIEYSGPFDTDGDGVYDADDAFPNDPNESADSDGDGVGDNADDFPNDPSESVDTDGDGVGDNADTNTMDDCKDGGWTRFTHPAHKNQGDCVSAHARAK